MKVKEKLILALTTFTAITLLFCLPQLSIAGSLEPSDPPGPTMKTLDQIPPTWSQTIQCERNACPRFQTVMDYYGGAAILDKETGLVWEQAPGLTALSWYQARLHCMESFTGKRYGWRLPTIEELKSLVDPTACQNCGAPRLPSGHPFYVPQVFFWSSTSGSTDTNNAYGVLISTGYSTAQPKTDSGCAWCVRGGQGYDAY